MSFLLRLASYFATWFAYLFFMSSQAPLGIGWLPWHLQRIYNAVEYLKLNGYLSSYGFSIWSKCQNCSLDAAEWVDKIYLSANSLVLSPYVIINHFWGIDALQLYGPIIDRFVILITAIVAAELIIKCVKSHSTMPTYFVGVACFTLFITSPWTYKMLLSAWSEVYFLMFLLLGFLAFSNFKNRIGYLLFFMAGVFHYQWAMAVSIFYLLVIVIPLLTKNYDGGVNYFPPLSRENSGRIKIIASLLIPAIGLVIFRLLVQEDIGAVAGSSLFTRIGISGDDIHNGGLLGALQFLGGNRITHCIADYSSVNISGNLFEGILLYNCMLSIGSMTILSLLAIIGILILLIRSELSKWIILPLLFAMLVFVAILQQSLSVHLMGYSYIFSFIFAAGISSLLVFFAKRIPSSMLSMVFAIPCLIGIVFVSIRVSMFTGING